jgi:anti-sigma B factor antagonist
MNFRNQGETLRISEIPELTAVNAGAFREEMNTALSESPAEIEIDLSKTRFLDSCGLGALFALYRAVKESSGARLRLLNPTPEVRALLDLTQMQQLFEIVQT